MDGLTEALALDETAWSESALCAQVDPDLFFPEQGQPADAAKKLCRSCRARWDCLDDALKRDERHGVWGGLVRRERDMVARGHWPRVIDDTGPEHAAAHAPERPRETPAAGPLRRSYSTPWPQPGDPILANPIVSPPSRAA